MKKILVLFGLCICLVLIFTGFLKLADPIPVTWSMSAIKEMHLPPPDTIVRVEYASEEYYHSLPEHVITKTHPVYIRESEPANYLDSLRTLEPEIVFDVTKLKTQEDWIKAGEEVFNWPVAFSSFNDKTGRWKKADFANGKVALTTDGRYESNRYIINEKGKIILGSLSCASCHTRILPSGQIVPGAQGNIVTNKGLIDAIQYGKIPFPVMQQLTKQLSYAIWAPPALKNFPSDRNEIVGFFQSIVPGVIDRQGGAYLYPLSVPDLIGLKDIRYLDHTGVMKHDAPGDLMRYAAFNQGLDMLTKYNGYIPAGKNNNTQLPSPDEWTHPFGYAGKRYSDAQLYALTLYIYSLTPPENPNHFPKALIEKGKKIFTKTGCVSCHTPPLYTNNKLTPVNGFEPRASDYKKYDIFNISVETDSVSALYSRRATGYYKVPSLRGVWYRGVFFHNGNLTSLEEVLDSHRLSPDYIPTGYKPPHLKTMAVKGHPFGLELNEKDKKALVAFLKTL